MKLFFRVLFLGIAILIAITGYRIFETYSFRQAAGRAPSEQIVGNKDGDLSVIMFLDYQCPYCKDVYPAIKEATEKDGNVKVVLRLFPALGEESERLIRLVYAAGKQGKFLEIHDAFISHYGPMDDGTLRKMASDTGLDADRWFKDAEEKKIKKQVEKNTEISMKLGIYATPTFLVGKLVYTPVEKLPEVEDFQKLFKEARGE